MSTDDPTRPPDAPGIPHENGNGHQPWELMLFVAGQSPKSVMAYANLRKACDHYLPGRYRIELVDLTRGQASLAKQYQVVAIPTLIRKQPDPQKRIIGSLSDIQRLVNDLDLGSPILNPPSTPS
ncbi:circadian clock KaiB family protein [Luteolibacter flavescens]|uniref:Circadian clock KaiB family protein n=1 Tax=Luteolibacter flavescens TaxID=1859460 RepID=A0ABT3FRI0_9BACT|nr:circadian clock KaiB family protein [Luteolibacter flavescens]MCW1886196.1 circadian clock KaiB family protein [Luteolibacter flavescens]